MDDYVKRLLIPRNLGYEKVRIGSEGDGGYVLSKQHLLETSMVYSLGIGDNCDFDYELAEQGLKIYQFDHTVTEPPRYHKNFIFNEIKITSKTFNEHFTMNSNLNEKNILLKMDIEGDEYEFFQNIHWKTLDCFNQIVFELHTLRSGAAQTARILQKISGQFCLIHITAHGPSTPTVKWDDVIDMPDFIELTYVNNRCLPVQPKWPVSGLDHCPNHWKTPLKFNWWL